MKSLRTLGALRLSPAYVLLLSALPFIIYMFWQVDDYRAALQFIAPGLRATFLATVISYLAAAVLGLVLVGMLTTRLGKHNLKIMLPLLALLSVASLLAFRAPQVSYSLVSSDAIEAAAKRVAILKGTPNHLIDHIRAGSYAEDASPRSFRSVNDVATALARLESGTLAAFIPSEMVPAGYITLWQVSFLPSHYRNLGLLLASLAILLALLSFAAWQSGKHQLAIFAELYVDAMRGIPMLVIILYVGFPLQGAIKGATGGFIDMSELTRGIVAISLGYAAYMAEVFRAGFEAIPKGQVEAARSLGLSRWQTMRHIVLPQAIRVVIPPLGNEFIAMLKDTSLLSVLSVRDITQRAREYQSSTFQVFEPFNTVALLYIGLTLAASSLIKWLERRSQVQEAR